MLQESLDLMASSFPPKAHYLGAELVMDEFHRHPWAAQGPKACCTVLVSSRSAYRIVKMWAMRMGYTFSRPGRRERRDARRQRYLTGNTDGLRARLRVWDKFYTYNPDSR